MKIDILFIDAACSKQYNYNSLEEDTIGGTESSTIRLAEGFGSKGLKVAIANRFNSSIEESPNQVQYIPIYMANKIHSKNTIFIRACGVWENFPESKKFLWLHDASKLDHNNMSTWVPNIIKHQVQGVAVSDWHIQNILSIAPGMPLKRIYSPVDEFCYRKPSAYDHNQLVWLSSPHKGLKQALETFKKLRQKDPNFKLAVFNPGYYHEDMNLPENVVVLPEMSKKVLRSVVSKSLCIFYPTYFEETFGLVAAESNALGTPVASYKIAALAESSSGPFAESEDQLINQVLEWKAGKRPVVTGQERFRFETIYQDWLKVLDL